MKSLYTKINESGWEILWLSVFIIVMIVCCFIIVSTTPNKQNNKIPVVTLYDNWCDDESCYSRETSKDNDNKYFSEKIIKRNKKDDKLIYERTETIKRP